jgi:ferritin-like metal-binding protein YciE
MKEKGLQDLFLEEIQDLLDAEKQITKALPKMAKAATSAALRAGFEEHLAQTEKQITRLERVFEELGQDAKGKKCEGMKGLLEEGQDLISNHEASPLRDAGLIAAAQKVEHYEIAGYGTARTFAETLGFTKSAQLLEQTLDEEKTTDEKLSDLAETINAEAAGTAPEGKNQRSTASRQGAKR